MPIETIRGEPFNITFDGPADAPVLLLSNSLGTNLSMWDPQIPEWSKAFRVVRYDSRGHGQSTAADKPYSIAMLGEDALAILDHLGVAKAHWCGLSKGGMVGQWLATHAGKRLDRVVLANTGARMGHPISGTPASNPCAPTAWQASSSRRWNAGSARISASATARP